MKLHPLLAFCALPLGFLPSAAAQNASKLPRSAAFQQEIAAAKREGIPVSAQELQAPLPPDSQNAAPLYAELRTLLKTKPLSPADRMAADGIGHRLPPPAQMEQLRRALTDRQDVTNLIHQIAARPKCVVERDWSQGIIINFPEFGVMRSAARWLSAESALLLYDGKPLEAVSTQALGFQIARHTAADPIVISYLAAVAIDALALGGMELILSYAGDKPQVAQAVQRAIEKDCKPMSLTYALRGEAVSQIILLDMLHAGGPKAIQENIGDDSKRPEIAQKLPRSSHETDALLNQCGVMLLTAMRKVTYAVGRPYPAAFARISSTAAEREKIQNDPTKMIAELFQPLSMYRRYVSIHAATQAHADSLRAACALLIWKANHGTFPAKLKEAVTPVPTDPFDGKPLRYRKEKNGFVVYSVGETGKFDGFSNHKPRPSGTLFRYPQPDYIK